MTCLVGVYNIFCQRKIEVEYFMNIALDVIFVLGAVILFYGMHRIHKKHITSIYNLERKLLLIAQYQHAFKYIMESNISSDLKSSLVTFDDISDLSQKSAFINVTINGRDFTDLDKNDPTMANTYLTCMNHAMQYTILHCS